MVMVPVPEPRRYEMDNAPAASTANVAFVNSDPSNDAGSSGWKLPLASAKDLRLFPDLRWEKEVRWERTAMKGRPSGFRFAG
jgi:hypothetical protein